MNSSFAVDRHRSGRGWYGTVCFTVPLTLWGLWATNCVRAQEKSETARSAPAANARPLHLGPLFPFCFDVHDAKRRDLQQQAQMVRALGFRGAGHIGLDGLAARVQSLEAEGLKLFLAGMRVHLDQDLEQQLDQLRKALPALRGREVVLYINLAGAKPWDRDAQDRAATWLRQAAAAAAPSGTRLGIYPHTGDPVDRVDKAVALARRVNHPQCGVIFNLCHWLRNDRPWDLATTLRQAAPYLTMVTINGADVAGRNEAGWNRLIQPLDSGTYDVRHVLTQLDRLGYRGPIGLMCWGIGGDARDHLRRSLAVWQRWTKSPCP